MILQDLIAIHLNNNKNNLFGSAAVFVRIIMCVSSGPKMLSTDSIFVDIFIPQLLFCQHFCMLFQILLAIHLC